MNQEIERLRSFERDQSRHWVEARAGQWDHGQWQLLLSELRRSGWLDVDPESIGRVLERRKLEFRNLRVWRDAGEAWRWVAARGGRWARHERLTLLAGLQCWLGPIDADALDETLAAMAGVYREWRRWLDTRMHAGFVERHAGEWGHGEWLSLLRETRAAGFALPADLIGLTLEDERRTYGRARNWEASREPYRWVEARRGRWEEDDVRRLAAALERSEYGPSLGVEAVRAVLERARQRYEALRDWLRTGEALAWVFERRGEWDHAEWLALSGTFAEGEVEPWALGEALEALRDQYVGLQRWLDRRSAAEERVMLDEPKPARLAA